jgi:hypothetical protein
MKSGARLDSSQRFVLNSRIALELSPGLAFKFSIVGMLFIPPQIACADEIRASADVTATAGWTSNPFSEVGHNQGSADVDVNVRPTVSLVAEHSVLSLNGLFDYQHYFSKYDDSNDYGAGLDYSATLSSRLNTHADVRYDSAIIGGFNAIIPVTDPTVTQPVVTTGPDLALIGSRQRRSTLSFADDTGYTLSSHDSLTANAYYSQSRYGGGLANFSNYHGYGGGAGYSRRISSHLQLGAQASVSRYDYDGPQGNSKVYSLQATFKDQISDTWSTSGALGVSFSDQSLGGKRTNLTGNVQLCRLSPRATLCLNLSDAVLPTGGTGTVNTKTAGVSYSYHLTEHSTISASGQYSRNDEPVQALQIPQFSYGNSYITASANYDRDLQHRIHLVATTHFRKIMGNLGNYPADFGGSIGFSIRLGDYR